MEWTMPQNKRLSETQPSVAHRPEAAFKVVKLWSTNESFFDVMERPGQTGYLLLNEEGAVLSSSGDLENDEKSAVIIMGLLNITSHVDSYGLSSDGFKKLSLIYGDHCYVICLSNRRIHVVKKTLAPDFSQNGLGQRGD